jgi:hypothetical protein
LGKKNVYEYGTLSVGIPSKYHKDILPFLDKDLHMKLKVEKNRIVIVLEPRENVSADRKTLGKNT